MTDCLGRRPATPADIISGTLRPSTVAVVFEPGPQRVLARVRGEIDLDDAPGLREDLVTALEASQAGLDVDLSAVTFCDSSGLHILLDLNRLATESGKSLVLTALSRPVARLLQITGAQRVLTVRDRSGGTARPVITDPVPHRPGRAPGPVQQAGAPRAKGPRPRHQVPDVPRVSTPKTAVDGTPWSADLPDVCDLCRTATPAGTAVHGHAADSSFAHPLDPGQDGHRPLLACTPAHLADLRQRYSQRPFVDAELWAVKIDGAMRRHPYGLSIDSLREETGLTVIQIEEAETWRHRPDRT